MSSRSTIKYSFVCVLSKVYLVFIVIFVASWPLDLLGEKSKSKKFTVFRIDGVETRNDLLCPVLNSFDPLLPRLVPNVVLWNLEEREFSGVRIFSHELEKRCELACRSSSCDLASSSFFVALLEVDGLLALQMDRQSDDRVRESRDEVLENRPSHFSRRDDSHLSEKPCLIVDQGRTFNTVVVFRRPKRVSANSTY